MIKIARLAMLLALIVSWMPVAGVHAVEPDEILADSALEARARKLSAELRCLVCQNQSIDDSNAPLARDLRLLVRERLKAGDTDSEVISFVVSRYGEFVLLRPRLGWNTLILWLSAPFLLIVTCLALYLAYRRRQAEGMEGSEADSLSVEEQEKLKQLLKDE